HCGAQLDLRASLVRGCAGQHSFMKQERFIRLRELFDGALEVPESQREQYLLQHCPDDEALRLNVKRLLSKTGERLESFGAQLKGLMGASGGDKLGPYTLLHPVGEGGMGDVWLAQQKEPLKRRVAVKVIKPGFDSRQIVGRFELERQTLALMDHPSIAKVFDAGSTPLGRPYFVMEYVEGEPITDFCDTHQYTIAQRVKLLHKVCHAVQHAHQKGVIHRDLKPSNILVSMVDSDAMVKIIDFGIAKVVHGPLSGATQFTELHKPIGTPEYMSPEQFDPTVSVVDIRSDVYALGVILFELLTSITPASVSGRQTQTALATSQTKPSTVIPKTPDAKKVAVDRSTSTKRLSSLIRGDLDWIALKALAPEVHRRYESVTAFLGDLNAFLEARPIEARPPSAAYLIHRFVMRHRLFAATGSVAIVAAVLILVSTQFALNKARQSEARAVLEAARSEQAFELLVSSFNLTNPMEGGSRELTAQQVLDAGVENLDSTPIDDDAIKAKIRKVLGTAYYDLAYYEQAEVQLERALTEANTTAELIEIREVLANLYWARGPVEKAETMQRQVLKDHLELHGPTHPETLNAQAFLAGVLLRLGKFEEARRNAEYLVSIGSAGEDANPSSIIQALSLLSSIHLQDGDVDAAEIYAREAYERNLSLHGADHIITRGSELSIASILRRQGRYDEAAMLLEDLQKYAYDHWGPEHKGYFRTLQMRGRLEKDRGDLTAAGDYFSRTYLGYAKILEPNHPDLVRVGEQLDELCGVMVLESVPEYCEGRPKR
ncbi:MAG: serine/threonine-protein kinase, partial [Pseudomonadota bacterium]